jgi:heme O synthase-like polyprenyltransferase
MSSARTSCPKCREQRVIDLDDILFAGSVDFFCDRVLWQFPHFMAIAWMYREDYDRAGYAVLPPGRARVPFVVWQTTLPLVALVLASLLPVVMGNAGLLYGIGALCLDGAFLYYGAQFGFKEPHRRLAGSSWRPSSISRRCFCC